MSSLINFKNNNKTKELVATGIFLSLSIIMIIIQIPIYNFLSFDFSLFVILFSLNFIKLKNTFLIAIITPFFALFSYFPTDIIGIFILEIIFNSSVFLFGYFKKNTIPLIFIKTILVLVTIFCFNLVLFYPLYFSFDFSVWNSFWDFFIYVFILTIVSTLLRLAINILLYFIIFSLYKKNN